MKLPMFLGLAAAITGPRPASGQDCGGNILDCSGLPASPPTECDEAELNRSVCCAQADVDTAAADVDAAAAVVDAAAAALADAHAALSGAEGALDAAESTLDAAEIALRDVCRAGWLPTIGQAWVR